MKILAALKRIKHLDRKIEKHMARIGKWCSYIVEVKEGDEPETPIYNTEDLRRMRQQVNDWTLEKGAIRHALHVTNMETKTEFEGKLFSIDALLLIQNVVIPQQIATWKKLRRLEKSRGYGSYNDTTIKSWVELQYDPKERDTEIERHEHRLEKLDEVLDTLNIETDIIGLD
jgi:hypothetical protein